MPISEGYAAEPKSEGAVLLAAAARIQDALPSSWTVRTKTGVDGQAALTSASPHPDLQLSLVHGGTTVLTYAVEATRVLASHNLLPTISRLLAARDARRDDSTRTPPMLVARYLSPPQSGALEERGIAYADATGNLHIESDDPLILLSSKGASADPWRGPGRPTTSLKGLPAAQLVRALADFIPPYTVAQLADLAGASLGAAYRLSDYLLNEGLLSRGRRGPITDVDWPEMIRRWSADARYLDTSTIRGYLEPRGLNTLVARVAAGEPSQRYALSGSLAAKPYATYAEARLALIYADDPVRLASSLGLRPVEAGANVLLAAPRSRVVFERTSVWDGVTIVAPSQAAADLLAGPGRNPVEGDHLLGWMRENESAWRRQPDR